MAILKRYLTDNEQRRLLGAAKGCAGPLALRDYSWMRLLIETGMRVNELATLSLHQAQQALVLQEARVLYDASRFLSGRYASFAKLMADPLVGRCMRLSAAQRVRAGARTR